MTDIQKQVENFIHKWSQRYKPVDDDLYALIRKVVEECCEIKCVDCRAGDVPKTERRYGGSGAFYQSHMHGSKECGGSDFRRHFLWLDDND